MPPVAFRDSLHVAVFYAAVAIWYIPELLDTYVIRRPRTRATSPQDRGSYAFLILTLILGLILGSFAAYAVPIAAMPAAPAIYWVGIALILLGVVLRWYAILTLGRYFTRGVQIHERQVVVQRGPYSFIRHPAYSGTLLTLLGIGLALTNWASLLAILAGGLVGHLYRVRIEEAALKQSLGAPYAEYMRHTKRFIPWVF